jgi:ABC-type glycerol-3-phosphate transport system permease component
MNTVGATKHNLSNTIIMILLIIISLACLTPLWYDICISISKSSYVYAGYITFWPQGINFSSYKQLLMDNKFFAAFGVSIERVILGGITNFILTILTAYPLSKDNREFRARSVFIWILVFTMLFNAGLIPWYMTIKNYGLIDNIWALVLPGAVPVFNVILLLNFFRNIPKELDEAGAVDGANPWYMLLKIYVPLSLPSIATVTLFSIVGHWNSFFDGLVLMNNAAHYPLQTFIQQLTVQIQLSQLTTDQIKLLSQIGVKTLNAAKIIVSTIPILIIYPFIQRFFIHGITLGSVKE